MSIQAANSDETRDVPAAFRGAAGTLTAVSQFRSEEKWFVLDPKTNRLLEYESADAERYAYQALSPVPPGSAPRSVVYAHLRGASVMPVTTFGQVCIRIKSDDRFFRFLSCNDPIDMLHWLRAIRVATFPYHEKLWALGTRAAMLSHFGSSRRRRNLEATWRHLATISPTAVPQGAQQSASTARQSPSLSDFAHASTRVPARLSCMTQIRILASATAVYIIGRCPETDPAVSERRAMDLKETADARRAQAAVRASMMHSSSKAASAEPSVARLGAAVPAVPPHAHLKASVGGSEIHPISAVPYFRVIRVDRTLQRPEALSKILDENGTLLTQPQADALLSDMERRHGAVGGKSRSGGSSSAGKNTGAGLVKINAITLLGCIKLLHSFSLVYVAESSVVGTIGPHEVHSIRKIGLLPLTVEVAKPVLLRMQEWFQPDPTEVAEDRYKLLFEAVQLENESYFSPTYDLTRPLQEQVHQTLQSHKDRSMHFGSSCTSNSADDSREYHGTAGARRSSDGPASSGAGAGAGAGGAGFLAGRVDKKQANSRPRAEFMWNSHIARELSEIVHVSWITPIFYGYFDQRVFRVVGKTARLTLLGRRLTEFAGTRYLKRGISSKGFVANDVEVEQMLEDGAGQFGSFVQVRGSVPVAWSQKTSFATAKPKIELDQRPSGIIATKRHFAHLMERYGAPICVLNLLKKSESSPREVRIGSKFATVVRELNASLPAPFRIQFAALDFDRLQKSEGGNVVDALHDAARWSLINTGLFVAKQGKMPVTIPSTSVDSQGRLFSVEATPSGAGAGAGASASAFGKLETADAANHTSQSWGDAVSVASSTVGTIPGLAPLNRAHGQQGRRRKRFPPSASQRAMAFGFPPDAISSEQHALNEFEPNTVSTSASIGETDCQGGGGGGKSVERWVAPIAYSWRANLTCILERDDSTPETQIFARHRDENPLVISRRQAARAGSSSGAARDGGGVSAAPSVAWLRCGNAASGAQGPLDPSHGGTAMMYGGGRLQAYDTKRRARSGSVRFSRGSVGVPESGGHQKSHLESGQSSSSLKNPRSISVRAVDWDDKFAPRLPPAFEHGQVAGMLRSIVAVRAPLGQHRSSSNSLMAMGSETRGLQRLEPRRHQSHGIGRAYGSAFATQRTAHHPAAGQSRDISSQDALQLLLGGKKHNNGVIADGEISLQESIGLDMPGMASLSPSTTGSASGRSSRGFSDGSQVVGRIHRADAQARDDEIPTVDDGIIHKVASADADIVRLDSQGSIRSTASSPLLTDDTGSDAFTAITRNAGALEAQIYAGQGGMQNGRPLKALMPKDFAARAQQESARSQFRDRQISKKRHASVVRPESAHAISAEDKYVVATGLRDAEVGFAATAQMGFREQAIAMLRASPSAQRVFADRMQAWESAGASCSSVVVRQTELSTLLRREILPGYFFVDLIGRARVPWVPQPTYALGYPYPGHLARRSGHQELQPGLAQPLHLEAVARVDPSIAVRVGDKLRGFESRPATTAMELSIAAQWPGINTADTTGKTESDPAIGSKSKGGDPLAQHGSSRIAGAWWGLRQSGVTRTNCVDCLDRTNSGQEQLGMYALSCMFQMLDYVPREAREGQGQPTHSAADTPGRSDEGHAGHGVDAGLSHFLSAERNRLASNLWCQRLEQTDIALNLAIMYEEMGDRIALQYGGSEAHHKISRRDRLGLPAGGSKESLELVEHSAARREQIEKEKQSSAATGEDELALSNRSRISVLTSIQRYYSNSFTDAFKQDSINIFLGKYRPAVGLKHLWDLDSDHALHNDDGSTIRADLLLADDVAQRLDALAANRLGAALSSASGVGSLLLAHLRIHASKTNRLMGDEDEAIGGRARLAPVGWQPPLGLLNFWSQPVDAFYRRSLHTITSNTNDARSHTWASTALAGGASESLDRATGGDNVHPSVWVPVLLRSARTTFDQVAMQQPYVAPLDIVHIPRRIAPPPIAPVPARRRWDLALDEYTRKGLPSERKALRLSETLPDAGVDTAASAAGTGTGTLREPQDRRPTSSIPSTEAASTPSTRGMPSGRTNRSRRGGLPSVSMPPLWLANNPRACLWHPTLGVKEVVDEQLSVAERLEGWMLVGGSSATTGQALLDAMEQRSGLVRRESIIVDLMLPSKATQQLLLAAGDRNIPRVQRRAMQQAFFLARRCSAAALQGQSSDTMHWAQRLTSGGACDANGDLTSPTKQAIHNKAWSDRGTAVGASLDVDDEYDDDEFGADGDDGDEDDDIVLTSALAHQRQQGRALRQRTGRAGDSEIAPPDWEMVPRYVDVQDGGGPGSQSRVGAARGGRTSPSKPSRGKVTVNDLRGVPQLYSSYCATQSIAVQLPATAEGCERGAGVKWQASHRQARVGRHGWSRTRTLPTRLSPRVTKSQVAEFQSYVDSGNTPSFVGDAGASSLHAWQASSGLVDVQSAGCFRGHDRETLVADLLDVTVRQRAAERARAFQAQIESSARLVA